MAYLCFDEKQLKRTRSGRRVVRLRPRRVSPARRTRVRVKVRRRRRSRSPVRRRVSRSPFRKRRGVRYFLKINYNKAVLQDEW